MKTYRINKNAARLAQGTGFAPELIYNISLVRFQGRNGRCIAAVSYTHLIIFDVNKADIFVT